MPRVFPNVTADPALAAIVGTDPIPRHEVTKRIWAYIKANGCQDARQRRMVNPDANLAPVFGTSPISMFEIPKCISRHLVD